MRPRARLVLCALAFALATAACSEPAPPALAVRQPSLDAADLDVLRAVLADLRERRVASRFLAVDTTLAICERPVELFGAPPGGCLAPRSIDSVSKVLEPGKSRLATLDFEVRNARRLPITEALGADVTFVSATLTDFTSATDLLREHPGSALVTFSAPSYPASGAAVIIYRVRDSERAAVRLERQAQGRWTVAERYGGME